MAGATTVPWEGVQDRNSLGAIRTAKPDPLSSEVTRRPSQRRVRLREELGMDGPVDEVDAVVARN